MDYDLFLSYNWSIQDKVKILDNKLRLLGYKLFRDVYDLEKNENPLSTQLAIAIRNSKIVICCINKGYCESQNCNLEIDYAHTLAKPLIVLMIDKLNIEEISDIQVKGRRYKSGIGFIIKLT